jgi:hypothetical protein
MANARMTALFVGGVVLAASSPLMAQRWGRESTPRDGACFYEDGDFGGDYFCLKTGEDLRFLPDGMNDRISSIRIFGRAEVTVFNDVEYGGPSTRFHDDVRSLGREGWNDRISSLRVRKGSEDDYRRRSGRGSSGRWQEDPDRIVRRAYQDILDRQPDAAGLRLYRSRIIDDGWSEGQVREALRDSPEYRGRTTMTRAKAEEIVRRAYRSVLDREPDAGSRGYVDKVFRGKWSQDDVERELRKSPEYRNRNR